MPEAQIGRRRRGAIAIFGLSVVVFAFLGVTSFTRTNRPDPSTISFAGQTAVDGKRVFQAYDCMGCHTLVGNGAYFAPDLTAVYGDDGPAWLMAFFDQLKIWPTQQMTEGWISKLSAEGVLDLSTPSAYYQRWQAAEGDSLDRGGWTLLMPALRLKPAEMRALIAYLDYASRLDTQGWPPEPTADDVIVTRTQDRLHGGLGGPTSTTTATPDGVPSTP